MGCAARAGNTPTGGTGAQGNGGSAGSMEAGSMGTAGGGAAGQGAGGVGGEAGSGAVGGQGGLTGSTGGSTGTSVGGQGGTTVLPAQVWKVEQDARRDHMTMGAYHACVIVADGSPKCWGHGAEGRTTPPAGLKVGFLAASHNATCAINQAGDGVKCWGPGYLTRSVAPIYLALRPRQTCIVEKGTYDVVCSRSGGEGPVQGYRGVQVAGDGEQMCAIGIDGLVTCWGESVVAGVPATARALRIAVGSSHACIVNDQHSVQCWGANRGTYPQPSAKARDVAVNNTATCLLTQAGDIQCGGISPPTRKAVAIYGSFDAFCALGTDGKPFCWGSRFGTPQNLVDHAPNVKVLGF